MTIFWRWFSKSINSAPELLLAYQGILRQTNFPVLVIPFATAAVELVFFFFGFVVLLAALVIGGVKLSWVALLLPWPFFVQLVLTVALSTMLASVGVFLRDLGQVVHLFTGIWFYLSPGIYPIEKIPEAYRQLYQINPFATLMPAYKAILLDGQMPNVEALAVWTGVSAALLGLSMAVLRRLRPRFYKVL
jgi:lipopolysaccharide transport system permease protein